MRPRRRGTSKSACRTPITGTHRSPSRPPRPRRNACSTSSTRTRRENGRRPRRGLEQALAALERRDLIDALLVDAALEWRGQPHVDEFVGQLRGDDLRSDDEYVRVVVTARDFRGKPVEAEAGPDASHLVAGDVLALSTATDDDAAIRASVGDPPADVFTQRRIVDDL